MNEYAKIYLKEGLKPIILKNPRWKGEYLTGIEVNKYGDEVTTRKSDETLHVIAEGMIRKIVYLIWNMRYAELRLP